MIISLIIMFCNLLVISGVTISHLVEISTTSMEMILLVSLDTLISTTMLEVMYHHNILKIILKMWINVPLILVTLNISWTNFKFWIQHWPVLHKKQVPICNSWPKFYLQEWTVCWNLVMIIKKWPRLHGL